MNTISKTHFFANRDVAMIVFIAAIFVLAVVYSVFSATTLGSNIETTGTLTVDSTALVKGALRATSTLEATGNAILYASTTIGTASSSPAVDFNVVGAAYITNGLGVGFATSGASGGIVGSGQLHVKGLAAFDNRVGISGTTSPVVDLGVDGDTFITGGLGVGYATTAGGNLLVTELARFDSRVGISGTTSPVADLGVDGSVYIIDGLGVGYATTSGFRSTSLGLFDNRLGVSGTNSPVVDLGVDGSAYVTGGLGAGFATTGTGVIQTSGSAVFGGAVGLNGTTSPYQGVGASGDLAVSSAATTTLSLESTGTAVAGCIEIKGTTALSGAGNRWVRIYVGGGRSATNTEATGTGGGLSTHTIYAGGDPLLVIEPGRCQ